MEIENGLREGNIATDRRGRRRLSAERRAAVLEEFARSGMTVPQFSRWAGIKYATLATWRQAQRRGQPRVAVADAVTTAPAAEPLPEKPALQWVQAVVTEPVTPVTAAETPALVVHGPGGVLLEIRSEVHLAWASRLLAQLGGPRPC